MSEYRFEHSVEVRFRDMDALGHVNHAVFLTYLEQARTAFLIRVVGIRSVDELGIILARVECDYRAPIGYPETIRVSVRCASVGTKSFALEYRILRQDGQVAAEARTVLVAYDYPSGRAAPLREEWRKALTGGTSEP